MSHDRAAPLHIRTPTDADYEQISEIYEHPDVIRNTSQIPYRDADFWRDYRRQRGDQAVALVAVRDQRIVGHITICPDTRPRRRHTAWFGLAVHVDCHRQGVGRALMHEMIRLADNWLNIEKIELGVLADNAGAIALYREFDFVDEGRLKKDLFTDGQYVDTLQMARFRPTS